MWRETYPTKTAYLLPVAGHRIIIQLSAVGEVTCDIFLTVWNGRYAEWLWSDVLPCCARLTGVVWGTDLNVTLIISVTPVEFAHTEIKNNSVFTLRSCLMVTVMWRGAANATRSRCSGWQQVCPLPSSSSCCYCLISCFTVFPVHSSRHIFWHTNAARNTGLPLQLLFHPPCHCLRSCTLAEWAGPSPHWGVREPLVC